MMSISQGARRALIVAGLALVVSACILAPGRFGSQLELRRNGKFSFSYTGEILMVPLMEAEKKKDQPFTPSTCRDEDTYDERECTPEDLARQKTEWEESRARSRKSDSEAARMMLGGFDPNDPKTGEEMAARLRRQAGWKKVEYLGAGKFDVDYAVSGTLDHDFTFPSIEGFAMSNAFVQAFRRADGTVRVEAPGFGPPSGGPAAGMMAGIAQGAMGSGDDAPKGPSTLADGTFALVTDGEILANNTDEGAKSVAGGKALSWKVDPRIGAAPTALVRLSR